MSTTRWEQNGKHTVWFRRRIDGRLVTLQKLKKKFRGVPAWNVRVKRMYYDIWYSTITHAKTEQGAKRKATEAYYRITDTWDTDPEVRKKQSER